ncbi:major facilitator superfamily domain-containing protein [Blakeslea trispora]|nr:major facilitator superfamily domain-containing protein [Blakeslea trispora]
MDEDTPLIDSGLKKKGSSWFPIVSMFLIAFSGSVVCDSALLAPHVQFYTEIFCYIHYGRSDISIQDCSIPPVQKMVSRAQAMIMFLTYASTLLSASLYGRLSDRKGRVIVLRISTLGALIYVACDLVTAAYYKSIGIGLMFVGPLVRGILVGESVLMAAVQAYIVDCTSKSSRTIVFARLMASLFIGSSIGPFMSSQLLKHTGNIIHVFYFVLFIDFANAIYTNFFIPESKPLSQAQQANQILKNNSLLSHINIFSALKIITKDHPTHMARHALLWIVIADFLLALIRRPPTLIYAMLKFKWTAYEGSLYYTYASLMKLMIMVCVLPLLSKLFKKETFNFDIWMVRIGIGIDAVCLALSGIASNTVMFATAGMLQSFSMLAQPSIRGLLTTMVNANQVGELLGAIAILDSVASIIAHLSINTLYSLTVSSMPNLTFFVCALIGLCSCSAAFLVKKKEAMS